MKQPTFTLYTTLGCHLCEEALKTLWQAGNANIVIEEFDIVHNDDIYLQYWDKIPVIVAPDGQTITYPFDKRMLAQWIAEWQKKA